MKASADDKLKVAQIQKFLIYMLENVVGEGEKDDYQHFILFPQCLQSPSSSRSFNSLPNDIILDVTKLKAFANDKLNVVTIML